MNPSTNAHSVISESATLGAGVEVGPFAIIENDVVIGDGTIVEPHCHIRAGTTIGAECTIFTGAAIGAVPQDLKFGGETTKVEIGDRTVIREYVTIHRGTAATGVTKVGSDCLLMAYTHIAHDCRVGNNVILANAVQLGGHVSIDDWAILGGLTGVHQFQRIGKHAMVATHARVVKDVPPFTLAGNEPLRFIGVNAVGLHRRGFEQRSIDVIREAYRLIYKSGMNIGDGTRAVAELYGEDAEVAEIISFIEQSQRGVVPVSR